MRRSVLAGVAGTDVRVVHDPPWSVDRISDAGPRGAPYPPTA